MSITPRSTSSMTSSGPDELPDEFFRFGVAFADGRTTTNLPGAYWSASQGGPVIVGFDFGPRGRAGEIPGFVARWTVWPTPPPGPLIVACAWPAGGILEARLELGGPGVRAVE